VLASDLARLLDLRLPLVQAPMAGVSTPELAAAVSNAGGLGSIGIGASSVAAGRRMIEETRSRTSRPFNVNVFSHQAAMRDPALESRWIAHLAPLFAEFGATPPAGLKEIYKGFGDDEDLFQMLLAERPPVISFHFGLPVPKRLAAFKTAGIRTVATATNVQEARLVEQAGIDVVVAQGIEAGGHRGLFKPEERDPALSMAVLVRLLVREMGIPVVAAGGIMDEAGIRAALALGAAGVQMGTAFVLCPESSADAGYRAAMMSARAFETRMTAAISGRPARGLPNRLMDAVPGDLAIPAYPVCYDVSKLLHAAAKAKGCDDFGAHWAGQGAPFAKALPAKDLIAELQHAFV
jgi:nitronate monooxygenase